MIKIAPSILSADFSKLGEDVLNLQKYGADIIHIDVMDGHFVPNITFGMPIIKSIRPLTSLPFDVHLMIDNPECFIDDFKNAGADSITVHYETDKNIDRTINYIKSLGLKAGIALNPGTPVAAVKDLITEVDMILVMTVNPGYGNQKYIRYTSKKIKEVKELSMKYNDKLHIEVDGGINENTISEAVKNGADIIVAGSKVFKDGKIKENIEKLRKGASVL